MIVSLTPWVAKLRSRYRDLRAEFYLKQIAQINCDIAALSPISRINLVEVLHSPQINVEWPGVEQEVLALGINNQDGSNSGDSRAVYYLLRSLQPRSVLEIGTRLGATTARMALAMRNNSPEVDRMALSITTVDLDDVNAESHWQGLNRYSPRESLKRLAGPAAIFVQQGSLNYFASKNQKYDLIFLDGDHAVTMVYREIPAALRALNPGGWILLHDYFPNGQRLWDDSEAILGPYLAVRRLQYEGAPIQVLPFGVLPWWTRSNSSLTSLALLGRKP